MNRITRFLPLLAAAGLSLYATPVSAQTRPVEILSTQVTTARSHSELRLELSDNRAVDIELRNGHAYLNGADIGSADGGELNSSFRELLEQVTEASSTDLPRLLADWSAPDGSQAGQHIDRALEDAVRGVAPSVDANGVTAPGADANAAPLTDSVSRLNERISEMQQRLNDLESEDASADITSRRTWMPSPLRWITRGLADVFSTLIIYAILLAIGIAVIFFGGRKYIEGVADTARNMTMRSWLVGLAGTFLVIPAYVLGIIALAISIVGIPALLIWVPLFPVAFIGSLALGYLAVAHSAGESLAERRLYLNDWFQRGNSYYFLLTGLGILIALFVGAAVMEMAGPWFGFLRGLMIFFGVVVTWAAFTIGFGAVLVSRGGTRPLGRRPITDTADAFSETADV